MQKIPMLFLRDPDNPRRVTDQVNPECQWVFDGEGAPHPKWDGTACLVRGGRLFKRYELKPGRTPPPDFEPAQEPDPNTGKTPGWVPVGDGPEDRWHREAYRLSLAEGTYELIGPKVQGNPHSEPGRHWLSSHKFPIAGNPRTREEIRAWLDGHRCEGIVWHHPDGRMAKIRRKDFGLSWPVKQEDAAHA